MATHQVNDALLEYERREVRGRLRGGIALKARDNLEDRKTFRQQREDGIVRRRVDTGAWRDAWDACWEGGRNTSTDDAII